MNDAELWFFNAVVLVIVAVTNVVLQSFALHVGLARERIPPGPYAGLRLLFPILIMTFVWLVAGIAAGVWWSWESCTSADRSALWLGVGYILTAWPAWWMARRARSTLPTWYWLGQGALALVLIALGGLACV